MSPVPDSTSVDVVLLMSDAPVYQLEFQVRAFEAWLTSLIPWPCNKISDIPESTELCTGFLS